MAEILDGNCQFPLAQGFLSSKLQDVQFCWTTIIRLLLILHIPHFEGGKSCLLFSHPFSFSTSIQKSQKNQKKNTSPPNIPIIKTPLKICGIRGQGAEFETECLHRYLVAGPDFCPKIPMVPRLKCCTFFACLSRCVMYIVANYIYNINV